MSRCSESLVPSKWLAANTPLRACSPLARGVFLDIVHLMAGSPVSGELRHATGTPITEPQLARLTGCRTAEVRRALAELHETGVCRTSDGCLVSDMVKEHAARTTARIARRRPKLAPVLEVPAVMPVVTTPPVVQDVAPAPTPKTVSKAVSKAKTTDEPAGFSEFWAAYPNKVAKAEARKAFAALAPSADLLAEMVAALEWQKTSDKWTKDDGQYIPHPATWLRAERWTDRPPEVVSGPTLSPAAKRAKADSEFVKEQLRLAFADLPEESTHGHTTPRIVRVDDADQDALEPSDDGHGGGEDACFLDAPDWGDDPA
jgi:hypothetical protein